MNIERKSWITGVSDFTGVVRLSKQHIFVDGRDKALCNVVVPEGKQLCEYHRGTCKNCTMILAARSKSTG